MTKANGITWATLAGIVLFATMACMPENPSETDTKTSDQPRESDVSEQFVWRGVLPDILQHERISRETLVQCGLGHTDLIEVPIIRGYPTPEAREMAQRGEVYLGGPAGWESLKVDCLICGYQYDPNVRAWVKYTSDPTHLHAPLPPAIAQFPIVLGENEERIVSWEQWIQYGEVVRNSIQYWSDASPANLADAINANLSSHEQHIEVPIPNGEERTLNKYEWTTDGLSYTLNILRVHDRAETHITFVEIIKQTEMPDEERYREYYEEIRGLMEETELNRD